MHTTGAPSVLMLPTEGNSNPYLNLLSAALRSRGAVVTTAPWMPLTNAVARFGRPDIIHIQWHHRYVLPAAGEGSVRGARRLLSLLRQVRSLKAEGIKIVWTVHNLVSHDGHLGRWEVFSCRLLARAIDRLVVHCNVAAEITAKQYCIRRDRITVVPHGNYVSLYESPPDRSSARERLGIPAATRVLLFFGQIKAYKGLEQLVRTFSSFPCPDVQLMIAGWLRDKNLGEDLRRARSRDPRIRLRFELLPDDVLVDLVRAADVVVLPYSKSLTSGAAVLAASLGRPILAPRIGCLREFDVNAGFFYEAGSRDALLAAIQAACTSNDLEVRGRAAFEFVRGDSWDRVATDMLTIYRQLLSEEVAEKTFP